MNRAKQKRRFTKKTLLLFFVGLILSGLVSFGYLRYSSPVDPPTVNETLQIADDSTLPVEIEWPPQAQASIGSVEHGILASKTGQTPQPSASTAKVIAALTILKEKPLALGEQGPTLTIDKQDIRFYNDYFAAGGSLVAVRLGQQLTQYQMLQGILIRSGNNLADSLAIWAFGSLSGYQMAAQQLVDELGMTNTTVGTDASGLSETTLSTAEDLTRLGIAAMKNDVVREIVGQSSFSLASDGTKPNTNWMLGENGVIGIKTGSLPSIGGVFMIASEFTPEGQNPITLVGAVQGEPTTYQAIARAGQLTEAAKKLFVQKTIIKKGDVVARVSTEWGETSDIVAAEDITTFGWKYTKVEPEIKIDVPVPFQKDDVLGTITIGEQTSNLIAVNAINEPSWQWRLTTER